MLLNSPFPILCLSALIGYHSLPSFLLTHHSVPLVAAQLCSNHNRPWIPIWGEIEGGGSEEGGGSQFLLASKIESDRSLAWFPLSGAAVIHLASPLSHPTLRVARSGRLKCSAALQSATLLLPHLPPLSVSLCLSLTPLLPPPSTPNFILVIHM